MPEDAAGHVEHEVGQTVGGQAGDAAEHHGEDQRRQQRLDDDPRRAEDGLAVHDGEIALDHHPDQVAVLHHAPEVDIEPALLRADDGVPISLFPVVFHETNSFFSGGNSDSRYLIMFCCKGASAKM